MTDGAAHDDPSAPSRDYTVHRVPWQHGSMVIVTIAAHPPCASPFGIIWASTNGSDIPSDVAPAIRDGDRVGWMIPWRDHVRCSLTQTSPPTIRWCCHWNADLDDLDRAVPSDTVPVAPWMRPADREQWRAVWRVGDTIWLRTLARPVFYGIPSATWLDHAADTPPPADAIAEAAEYCIEYVCDRVLGQRSPDPALDRLARLVDQAIRCGTFALPSTAYTAWHVVRRVIGVTEWDHGEPTSHGE